MLYSLFRKASQPAFTRKVPLQLIRPAQKPFSWGQNRKDPSDNFDPSHDYYKDLGLDKNASKETLKNQYYKKCYEYHPDRASGAHQDKFKEINAAYDVLKDEERRKRYDDARAEFLGQKPPHEEHHHHYYNSSNQSGPKRDWWTQGHHGQSKRNEEWANNKQ